MNTCHATFSVQGGVVSEPERDRQRGAERSVDSVEAARQRCSAGPVLESLVNHHPIKHPTHAPLYVM